MNKKIVEKKLKIKKSKKSYKADKIELIIEQTYSILFFSLSNTTQKSSQIKRSPNRQTASLKTVPQLLKKNE